MKSTEPYIPVILKIFNWVKDNCKNKNLKIYALVIFLKQKFALQVKEKKNLNNIEKVLLLFTEKKN